MDHLSPLGGRLLRALVLVALLAALVPLAGPSAAGASAISRAERQRELREDIAELSREEQRLVDELDRTERERERLATEIAALDARIEEVTARLAAAQERLVELGHEERRAQARLERTERDLAAAESTLIRQAVAAYIDGPTATSSLYLMVSAHDASRIGSTQTLVDAVVADQHRTVERVRDLRVEVAQLREAARAATAEAARLRDSVAGERAGLVAERDAADGLRARAEQTAAAHALLLSEVEGRRLAHEAELAALLQASAALAAQLAARQAGQVPVGAVRGLLAMPVNTGRMSSAFGPRIHPIFGTARLHAGVDFAAPMGTPVVAAADGAVVSASDLGGYGLTVILDHEGALATLYAHLSHISVAPGQQVQRGELVGFVGSTGNSTGPHLHFETRVHGTPVDPLHYL
jgi:murein DD-endopeptidase MepM/ murein hydrolase activator NlpD